MRKVAFSILLLTMLSNLVVAQVEKKETPALPEKFKELMDGPPSVVLMNKDPEEYARAVRKYYMLASQLQKEVFEKRLPESVLSVLHQPAIPEPHDSFYPYQSNTPIEGAGNIKMIDDFNKESNSYPDNSKYSYNWQYCVLKGVAYFRANDGIHGNELWRSDGTEQGTYMVKDIFPQTGSSHPQKITVFKNKLYFTAYLAQAGFELFCSDGTEKGTYLVKDIGTNNSYVSDFAILNDNFYLIESRNSSLWKTDGTDEGTLECFSFNALGIYNPENLTVFKNLLFFTSGSSGSYALYRTDGTSNGTFRISPSGSISNLTVFDDKLYFVCSSYPNTRRLWVTDGSVERTRKISEDDLAAEIYKSVDQPIPIISKSLLIYLGYSSLSANLYRYTPEEDSTRFMLVKDLTSLYGTGSTKVEPFLYVVTDDSTLFFVIDNENGQMDLWKSKATRSTTQYITTIPKIYPNLNFIAYHNKLYFQASSEVNTEPYNTYEPWVSDGTAEGTKMIKDINKGSLGSNPIYFTPCNGNILFTATDGEKGYELWTTGGKNGNTSLVKDINQNSTKSFLLSSSNGNLFTLDTERIVFAAKMPNSDSDPWVSNGKTKGTFLLKNITFPQFYTVSDKKAIFVTRESGYAIYATDGTTKGIRKITDSLFNVYSIINIKATNEGVIFYFIQTWGLVYELWSIERNGNKHLLFSNSYINNMAIAGNYCIFSASGGYIWASDGTIEGTIKLSDVLKYSSVNFISLGKNVIFSATDFNTFESGLYVTNGTKESLKKISEIKSSLENTVIANDKLYFIFGNQLYRTDGSTSGTNFITSIYPNYFTYPTNFCAAKDVVYFTIRNPSLGIELWKTEGKERNTKSVKEIIGPDNDYEYIMSVTSAGGKLYFVKRDSSNIDHLWVSEGTERTTKEVIDEGLAGVYSMPYLTGTGNTLFLGGQSYKYGLELYAGDVSGKASNVFSPIAKQTKAANNINVHITPNPARDKISIDIKKTSGKYAVTISNMQGNILWSNSGSFDKVFDVSISNYLPGNYFVSVTDTQSKTPVKMIFQKL